MTKTIDFEGLAVQYDDSQLNRWSVLKKLSDPTKSFGAIDLILCGRSDEVAEALGDDFGRMTKLLEAITAIEGNAGKN